MNRISRVRRSLFATLVGVLLFGAASAGVAADGQKAVPKVEREQAKVDRNRNKLLDDLETRLARTSASGTVNVIVTLEADATRDRIATLARHVGGFSVGRRIELIDGFSATVTKAEAERLARVPWVRAVEENSTMHALNDGAQASFGVAKARMDVPGLDGSDQVAAVIDTGIDTSHADLDEGKVVAFKDFVNGRAGAYDDEGHGTHVAATIAGDGDGRTDGLHRGVAPAANLVGVKVLDANGSGTMANVAAAIDWVVENKDLYGIDAVNLSLGESGCSDGSDAASLAVNRAEAAGVVVAVAAGNDGPGTCTIGSPGAAAGALTVGAMADTAELGFSQASFSSRGPTADGRIKPDVSAPGVKITSAAANTGSGYAEFSGTSMATPFVAGLTLLMRETNSAVTPQQVRDAVRTTADDWGRVGPDSEYGAGRLDAYAALKAVGAALTTGPAGPEHRRFEGTLTATGAWIDYQLSVADTAHPIAATLILPGVAAAAAYSPDFDLYLYNPAGTLVAAAETVERQETIGFRPTAMGTYRLRVRSYSGSGAYVVDASGGLGTIASPPPAPTTATAAPSSVSLYAGYVRGGGSAQLGADDNAYFSVNSTTSGTRVTDWYALLPAPNSLASLKITYRGKASYTCTQIVYVYNWTAGVWAQLDSRSVGTTESQVDRSVTGTLADYVRGETGDGEVAVRVRCSRGSGSFFSSADLLRITFQR